ncbi:hypothetical protein DPMN_159628 [Dreissena polymorpha]|uniref:Uncharacterized protein n=1 Tax=Dreissena polymorpha TaxID=45954 RepID=A0A9D4ELT6_DREPO|nr:hypothetical protein DPMN_159628 [Dreissena polymorpha]
MVIPIQKTDNLKLFENYRTISLNRNPSKAILRIILNRLKSKADQLLAVLHQRAGWIQSWTELS